MMTTPRLLATRVTASPTQSAFQEQRTPMLTPAASDSFIRFGATEPSFQVGEPLNTISMRQVEVLLNQLSSRNDYLSPLINVINGFLDQDKVEKGLTAIYRQFPPIQNPEVYGQDKFKILMLLSGGTGWVQGNPDLVKTLLSEDTDTGFLIDHVAPGFSVGGYNLPINLEISHLAYARAAQVALQTENYADALTVAEKYASGSKRDQYPANPEKAKTLLKQIILQAKATPHENYQVAAAYLLLANQVEKEGQSRKLTRLETQFIKDLVFQAARNPVLSREKSLDERIAGQSSSQEIKEFVAAMVD